MRTGSRASTTTAPYATGVGRWADVPAGRLDRYVGRRYAAAADGYRALEVAGAQIQATEVERRAADPLALARSDGEYFLLPRRPARRAPGEVNPWSHAVGAAGQPGGEIRIVVDGAPVTVRAGDTVALPSPGIYRARVGTYEVGG